MPCLRASAWECIPPPFICAETLKLPIFTLAKASSTILRSSSVGKYVARSRSFILKVFLEAGVIRTLATDVFLLPTASKYRSLLFFPTLSDRDSDSRVEAVFSFAVGALLFGDY